jgi:hypothetical protein
MGVRAPTRLSCHGRSGVVVETRDDELLDAIGKLLMLRVRDEALDEIDDIVVGRSKAEWTRELHGQLERSFDLEQRRLLHHLVAIAVDATIHNMLWLFESSENPKMIVIDEAGQTRNVAELSDGLSGELWTEDGWIFRFSEDDDKGRALLT